MGRIRRRDLIQRFPHASADQTIPRDEEASATAEHGLVVAVIGLVVAVIGLVVGAAGALAHDVSTISAEPLRRVPLPG
jgi:hypothetical protein